jgi:predicted S18 family serine protease
MTTQINSIPIKINDQNFVSISQAARFFQISLSTVRLRLNDPNFDNWNYINNEKRLTTTLARPVIVNDKYYLSVSLAAANEGITERTVRKNIKTKSNWNFFDQLSENQKNKIKNLNQQISDSQQTIYTLGRPVQVGTEVFLVFVKLL